MEDQPVVYLTELYVLMWNRTLVISFRVDVTVVNVNKYEIFHVVL